MRIGQLKQKDTRIQLIERFSRIEWGVNQLQKWITHLELNVIQVSRQ